MHVFVDGGDVVCAEGGKGEGMDPRAGIGEARTHDSGAEAGRGGDLFFVHDGGDFGDDDFRVAGKRDAVACEGDGGTAGAGVDYFFAGIVRRRVLAER